LEDDVVPDPLDLRNCLCANVRKTDRALSRNYDQALRSTGLTASQFAVLSFLSAVGPTRISDLARAMGMDQTTMTRNIGLLQEGGWVGRSTAKDRRTRVVSMTDHGRKTHSEATVLWTALQSELTAALGPGRFERFLKDLSDIQSLLSPRIQEES